MRRHIAHTPWVAGTKLPRHRAGMCVLRWGGWGVEGGYERWTPVTSKYRRSIVFNPFKDYFFHDVASVRPSQDVELGIAALP